MDIYDLVRKRLAGKRMRTDELAGIIADKLRLPRRQALAEGRRCITACKILGLVYEPKKGMVELI